MVLLGEYFVLTKPTLNIRYLGKDRAPCGASQEIYVEDAPLCWPGTWTKKGKWRFNFTTENTGHPVLEKLLTAPLEGLINFDKH